MQRDDVWQGKKKVPGSLLYANFSADWWSVMEAFRMLNLGSVDIIIIIIIIIRPHRGDARDSELLL